MTILVILWSVVLYIFHGYFHDDFILIIKLKDLVFKRFYESLGIIIEFYVPLKII